MSKNWEVPLMLVTIIIVGLFYYTNEKIESGYDPGSITGRVISVVDFKNPNCEEEEVLIEGICCEDKNKDNICDEDSNI